MIEFIIGQKIWWLVVLRSYDKCNIEADLLNRGRRVNVRQGMGGVSIVRIPLYTMFDSSMFALSHCTNHSNKMQFQICKDGIISVD